VLVYNEACFLGAQGNHVDKIIRCANPKD